MIRQMGGLPEIVAGLKAGQIQGGTFGFPAVLHARAAGFRVLVDYNTQGLPVSAVVGDRDGEDCCGPGSRRSAAFSKPISKRCIGSRPIQILR